MSLETIVRKLRVVRLDGEPVRARAEGHPRPADVGCGGFCRVESCIEIATGPDGFCGRHQAMADAGDAKVTAYRLLLPTPSAGPRRNAAGFVETPRISRFKKKQGLTAEAAEIAELEETEEAATA